MRRVICSRRASQDRDPDYASQIFRRPSFKTASKPFQNASSELEAGFHANSDGTHGGKVKGKAVLTRTIGLTIVTFQVDLLKWDGLEAALPGS